MGEIKSTLDIIMEKTKGLTITEEEKASFRREEIEKKVRGLLQKFLDGRMDMERLEVDIAALGEDRQETAKELLKNACAGLLDPEGENRALFEVLERIVGSDPRPIEDIIRAFQEDLKRKRALCEKKLLDSLKQIGITGSAVVPNPAGDPEWKRYMTRKREEVRQKLAALP